MAKGRISDTPSSIVMGVSAVSVANIPQALSVTNLKLKEGVLVTADMANTTTVYIGNINVTKLTGMPIAPGIGVKVDIDDLSKVYFVDDGTAGQKVRWLGG